MSKTVLTILLVSVFSSLVLAFSKPLYIINGNSATRLGEVFLWKNPYVELSEVATGLDLRWSYSGENGIVTNGKDFFSFNTVSHKGTYDALYTIENAASGTKSPYISLEIISKLTGLRVENEEIGYFLVKKEPSLMINGALLYGNKFTIFFKDKPLPTTINVSSHGMISTVTIFPILISKKYISPHSPLVVEIVNKYSVSYRITHTSKLTILTSLGFPSLPVQNVKKLDLGGGITYRYVDRVSMNKKVVHLGIVKIPPASNIKIVHPASGVGEKNMITSMISASSVAAIGLSASYTGFIMYKGKIMQSFVENAPLLVWNDQKFDIIETSPTISINIGNVPFNVDGINCKKGNVVIYTSEYGPVVPKVRNRIYFVVKDGKIVGRTYKSHPRKDEYVLSLTEEYGIFLKNVHLGDDFYIFISMDEAQNLKNFTGIIQGKCLLVFNSKKSKLWAEKLNECEGKNVLIAALKEGDLYLIRANSIETMSTEELTDMLLNMNFSTALFIDKGKDIPMIVNGKIVEFNKEGLYPVGFGIEIDKTTGGA